MKSKKYLMLLMTFLLSFGLIACNDEGDTTIIEDDENGGLVDDNDEDVNVDLDVDENDADDNEANDDSDS